MSRTATFRTKELDFSGLGTSGLRATLREMTDEDLMMHFQQGVVQAYDILVERYRDQLFSFIHRFLGDAATSEDLLQETFLRLHRNRHAYRKIAKFSTWVYTIAGNLARSEYRKRKRRKTGFLISNGRDNEEYEIEIPDLSYSPDRQSSRSFQSEAIQQALSEIPEVFREVVIFRDVQELTYEEIVEITGLPMGTVKSRINRGRVKLQGLLSDIVPFETA